MDFADDTELFWGLPNFNKMLLQDGNVQMEILLRKDEDFTFDAGWAFPRKIYFDGGECAMPPPDDYPQLPSASCGQLRSAPLGSAEVTARRPHLVVSPVLGEEEVG